MKDTNLNGQLADGPIYYRYEYKSKFLWCLSFLVVIILILAASVSFIRSKSLVSLLFLLLFSIAGLRGVYSIITKKIPFLEVNSEYIVWGETNRTPNKLELENISKIILDCGADDNDIIIYEKSGNEKKIYSIYFFTERQKLHRILYDLKNVYNYKIEKA